MLKFSRYLSSRFDLKCSREFHGLQYMLLLFSVIHCEALIDTLYLSAFWENVPISLYSFNPRHEQKMVQEVLHINTVKSPK
jgi:hypothetical protein